jgi:hypothetical protein
MVRARDGRAYGYFPREPGRAYAHGPGNSQLMGELKTRFLAVHGTWPDSKASANVSDYLFSQASRGPAVDVALRCHWDRKRLLIDVGDHSWRAIEVDGDSWRYLADSPVLFRRSDVMAALATPAPTGDLDDLWSVANIAVEDRPLVLALLICALLTGIAQPVAFFTGLHGTGKTELTRFLLSLIDPVTITERGGSLPTKEEDWKPRVGAYTCVLIDNASNITAGQSDTLCKISTGGEATTRTLYTNDGAHVSDLQVPVTITSIGVGALRADLQSRMVRIQPEALTGGYLALTDLREARAAATPSITRALLDLLVQVLGLLPLRGGREELSRPVDRRVTRLADHLLIRRVVPPACPCRTLRPRGRERRGGVRSRPASGSALIRSV